MLSKFSPPEPSRAANVVGRGTNLPLGVKVSVQSIYAERLLILIHGSRVRPDTDETITSTFTIHPSSHASSSTCTAFER